MGDFGLSSALSGVYNAVQFVFELTNVHADTHIVHEQLNELESTRRVLQGLLRDSRIKIEDGQRERINKLLFDASKFITKIAKPVEASRVDEQINGTTTLWHRITWVLRDKGTVQDNQPLISQYRDTMNREVMILSLLLNAGASASSQNHHSEEQSPGNGLVRRSTLGKSTFKHLLICSMPNSLYDV